MTLSPKFPVTADDFDLIQNIIDDSPAKDDGLLSGRLGLAFYYYNAFKITRAENWWRATVACLREILDRLEEGNSTLTNPSFSSGLAGLGYVFEYIKREGLPAEIELADLPPTFDDFLVEGALEMMKSNNVDFLHGAVGILHYYASLPASDLTERILEYLIQQLIKDGVESWKGTWWRNSVLKEGLNCMNMSLAHGQCGILLVLLNVLEKHGDKWNVSDTIRKGISFLLSSAGHVQAEKASIFPFFTMENSGETFVGNRLAWCYGDMNVAWLLYRAGTRFGVREWIEVAEHVGLATITRRTHEETLIADAHYCHGAAGVTHMYRALHRITGKEDYKEAFDFWAIRTLTMAREDAKASRYAGHEGSLLTGWPGIGLILMSVNLGVWTPWGEAFLLC
ncbi:lanthionine synthetase C family protein [Dinghuibacter silviterrae]|uniref:Lanthionine synthetase-like protein n=1 Tax=Dinghuibacter silviterrae TaxID=1539049 RepID=A0A4R8DRQ4_9BACT|nr:lanthionine synthetase C family protein [Dinghuibacter silviterrae]TDX00488.1 lanthionine synthetase-like protein [Dinghuibacter silviterrae]